MYEKVQGLFNSGYGYDWLDEGYGYTFYASGGYTGDWASPGIGDQNGKLAVLHQKELVLNATDTENILSAVNIVREVIAGLKSVPGGSILSAFTGAFAPTGDTIEQRVEISAEFPNVEDSEDIRSALLGLSDSAYQYAYKVKGKNE